MELKIDTKKDSDDDIRKAIRMLQQIVGDSPSYGSDTGSASLGASSGAFDVSGSATDAMAGLFGDDSSGLGGTSDSSESSSDSEDDEPKVEIIPY
ncbi:hypothetical protein JW711_03160 [Candidatus Woesearchaeota archaeon]|nr:hypothetical protein [Candidatus Woesearchaeota archaeon]